MLFYPPKHRVFRNCHTPKYVENREGQNCCNFHDFLASTWPQCYSIPQNTGFSYPLASAPCARERVRARVVFTIAIIIPGTPKPAVIAWRRNLASDVSLFFVFRVMTMIFQQSGIYGGPDIVIATPRFALRSGVLGGSGLRLRAYGSRCLRAVE